MKELLVLLCIVCCSSNDSTILVDGDRVLKSMLDAKSFCLCTQMKFCHKIDDECKIGRRDSSQKLLRRHFLSADLRGGAPELRQSGSDSIDDQLSKAIDLLNKVNLTELAKLRLCVCISW